MSLSDLTQSVKAQIVGTGSGNFSVTGVSRVVCNPPSIWNAGKTFQCFVYDSSSSELGEYDATILPNDSSGSNQWNGGYTPAG